MWSSYTPLLSPLRVYLTVNHNSYGATEYQIRAGEASLTLTNRERGRSHYTLEVTFTGEVTLEMECTYGGSEYATFWLAAVEDRSVQPTLTPTPSNTPTITPTFTPSATATATITLTSSITPTPSVTPTPSDTPTPTDTPIYVGNVFDTAIGASADDSYAYQEYYRWRNGADEDDIVLESTNVGGLRFAGVEIPAGARIDAAHIEVHVYHSDDPRLYLYAEAADDPADFSARRPDLSGRGAAFARWEGDDIGEGWRRSPDIGNLVQESVDRSGWESGNAFVILFQPAGGRFRFRQWDYGEGEYAARLHVEYSLAATPTPTATPTPEVREVAIEYDYDALNRLTAADYTFTGTGTTGEFPGLARLPLHLRPGGQSRLAALAGRTVVCGRRRARDPIAISMTLLA